MRLYFRYLVVLAALLLAVPAFSLALTDDRPTFKVEGTVINAVTGRPIPRALVEWNGVSGLVPVLTGSEGEFSFAGVPEGRGQFLLQKPGYLSGRGRMMAQTSVAFTVGADSGKLVMKLVPEAVISGRVLGKDGEPVEGASVRIEKAGGKQEWGRNSFLRQNSARTDEDGNFRIAELPPGQYVIAVQAGNVARRILGRETVRGAEAYPVIVYYPAGSEEANAEPVTLTAGQHAEANFSIAPVPAFKVTGFVSRAAEWKQVSSPHLVDRRGQVLLSAEEFDSQTGAFTFRSVPAGNYTIRVTGLDDSDVQSFTHHRIAVHKDVSGVSLSLSTPIAVTVNVRKEITGKADYQTSCNYLSTNGVTHNSDCSDYPAIQMELRPVDSSSTLVRSNWVPPAGDSLVLRGLQPGRYKVHATPGMGSHQGYVASLRCGFTDLLRDELVVPENGQLPPIEAVLRDDFGSLHLLVNADKKTFGTISVLSDIDESIVSGWTFSAESMLNRQLPPGNYKILAFADSEDVDANDPDELVKYIKNATPVTVTAGNISNVIVNLVHTGE
jgi:hypothetical protein